MSGVSTRSTTDPASRAPARLHSYRHNQAMVYSTTEPRAGASRGPHIFRDAEHDAPLDASIDRRDRA
jgi:hypothetical protein